MAQNSVFQMWQYMAPAGMQEVREYGLDVWQFINFFGEPIGEPFPLLRKPSRQNLASVHEGYFNGDSIRFCTEHNFGCKEYWRRLHQVYNWRLDPERLHIINAHRNLGS